MKIRNKFIITTTLTTVVIMSFFTFYLIYSQYNEQIKNFNYKITQLNEFAQSVFVVPIWNVDSKTVNKIFNSLMLDEYIEGIELSDDERIIIKSYKGLGGQKIVKNLSITLGDKVIGNAKITYTTKVIDQMTTNMVHHFIIFALVMIFSLYITIHLSAFSVTKPLENIIVKLQKISSGNYDEQISINGTGELKILQDTINQLCLELKQREQTIKYVTIESMTNDTNYKLEKQKYLLEKVQHDISEKLKTELENSNLQLKESLENQNKIQNQLILSEKMAVLGGLVAGVAHEINTPIGIGVSSASFLAEKTDELNKLLEMNQLKKSNLENYIQIAKECSTLLLLNLKKASELIKSFKQVSVDQTSEEKRLFNLKEYIDEILQSLHPKLKHTNHKVIINCDENITLDSYPGAVSQILTNLIMNSIIHGFEHLADGIIEISIFSDSKYITLLYKDNGKGISKEGITKVFQPFYTTKRNSGGTGLGTYIIYNVVTQRLGGTINITSEPEKGVIFEIKFPI